MTNHHQQSRPCVWPGMLFLCLLWCVLTQSQALSQVRINEFMASNSSIPDPEGEYDDWIELHNPTDQPVDLGGMYLTDDLTQPSRWQFPVDRADITTVMPGGYLLVWADDDVNQGPLHATFKLSQSGEQIGLFSLNGIAVDTLTYPAQQNDVSWAFDGVLGQWYAAPYPSPGQPNAQDEARILFSEIMYNPSVEGQLPEDPNLEFIELINQGDVGADLSGWSITRGVSFQFPEGTQLGPGGHIVVALSPEILRQVYGIDQVYGPWTGGLSNDGETLALADATGSVVNQIRYSDQGDWAERTLGPSDRNHRGWFWRADHDGQARSLELINTAADNTVGQNWSASRVEGGTPGQVNSVASVTSAPSIKDVRQSPPLPTSVDDVQVTATVDFGQGPAGNVTLYYRVDQSQYLNEQIYPEHDPATYTSLPMRTAGETKYRASIPAQLSGVIVEFYVRAEDAHAQHRTWPGPAVIDGESQQVANALYQVNDAWSPQASDTPEDLPVYHVIMTEMERARLADIGDNEGGEHNSDALMNATFISVLGSDVDVRYNVGVRNRGHGSRRHNPNNMRVNFRNDEPWQSVTAINLNAQYGYRQVIGSALFQLANMPVAKAKLVQVRINGNNLAQSGGRMYGSYAHVEVINSEFARRQFPHDNNGNLYKCMRDGGPGADLVYRGDSPQTYRINYFKQSNKAKDDWSDLFDLTYRLTESPDETYLEDASALVHVDVWLRYLAMNELLGNTETTLANGSPDDYYLYAGVEDPRFYLIQHDLDSIFQRGGVDILRFSPLPSVLRLVSQPALTSQYYRILDELMETVLSPAGLERVFGMLSLPGVPDSVLESMINYATRRYEQVRPRLHGPFTLETNLPWTGLFYESASESVMLFGKADPVGTGSVLVNGHVAHWAPLEAAWTLGSRSHPEQGIHALRPGLTRVTAEAFAGPNGTGQRLDSIAMDIAYRMDTFQDLAGVLTEDRFLAASAGPYRVTDMLTIPDAVTLTIEAGTTLFFEPSGGVTVQAGGCLQALGAEDQVIRWTRVPFSSDNWQGLALDRTRQDNRLCYVDFEYGDAQGQSVAVDHATILMDHVTFGGTGRTVLELHHPDATIRSCVFPSVATEPIHGTGLSGDDSLVFDRCIFGPASGNNDIIDFAGGVRPGPILQVYDCVFSGGSDDGLDLDGTDAHIQGNLFTDFRKDNNSDGDSSAVATGRDGGRVSRIHLAQNVFLNNDHAVLLKEDCVMVSQNNTFANTSQAAVTFGEPYRNPPRDPGDGAEMLNDLFWNNHTMFEHYFAEPNPDYGPEVVTVDHCLLPVDWHNLGIGNFEADPMLLPDASLDSLSPAHGAGTGGTSLGALGATSLTFSGVPFGSTWRTTATVWVRGPGITHYVYSLNDPNGPYSEERSVADPIVLDGLVSGESYRLFAQGQNSAGLWQDVPVGSATWQVQADLLTLRLNEVLVTGDTAPFAELYFDGPAPISGQRISLSRAPNLPGQLILATGLTPDSLIEIPLDGRISLNPLGDRLVLFLDDVVVDEIEFGAQIPNLAVGPLQPDGRWRVTDPTPGQANRPAATGNPRHVTINEWLAFPDATDAEDFIELHNPSAWVVDVGGFFLTDNPLGEPAMAALPPLTLIPAHGTLALTADNSTAAGHVPLKLSAEGEILSLRDPDLTEIDTILFGPQTQGVSQGRSPDGSDRFVWFESPSPGQVN